MEIKWTSPALKGLKKAPIGMAVSILEWLDELQNDPLRDDNNVKPLKGAKNTYRRRFADWRVVFVLDHKGRIIEVVNIAPRGKVYR